MKIFLKTIAVIVVLILAFTVNKTILIESYKSDSLFGSYNYKAERAKSIEENKVIIIGGSASNLGFDSKEFEKLSGIPVANLSISAGVPLRIYMRSAEIVAKKDDAIIMALEYGYYSKDFSSIDEIYIDMVDMYPQLKCNETFVGNIEYLSLDFLRSFTRVNDCFGFVLTDVFKTETTIYIADSVDEYGDFWLHKDRESTYKQVIKNENFHYNEEIFEEITSFVKKMNNRGISVYLTYPPIDGKSYVNYEKFFQDAQSAIEKHIDKSIIIGNPFDFIYDGECFFDTMYHLSYESRKYHTQNFYELYSSAIA